MKKKILFIATVASHINSFHIPDIEFFKQNGWETHVIVGTDSEIRGKKYVPSCDKFSVLPLSRSPFRVDNLSTVHKLKKIIDIEKFNIIHCHNPMGGVVARMAGRHARRYHRTKIIYTCHGAHFYSGAPIWNWILYYPVEKILSRYTDCLITINHEDYKRLSRNFKKCKVEYVPGVGFGPHYQPALKDEKLSLRKGYGYANKDFILMFVGELNEGKNQAFLIDVINKLKPDIPEIKLILVGMGELEPLLRRKVKDLGLEEQVVFLGYRTDVSSLLKIADVYTAASVREGLAVNVLEALGTGLPAVVLKARGQSDLIDNGVNGFIVNQDELDTFAERVLYFYRNLNIINQFSKAAHQSVEAYRIDSVRNIIEKIYWRYME
jgi:glycosyltransferase EpsD